MYGRDGSPTLDDFVFLLFKAVEAKVLLLASVAIGGI